MYYDQILFLLGGVAAATFLALIVFLLVSRKNSRMFTHILSKETEAFEQLSATLSQTQTNPSVPIIHKDMENVTEVTMIPEEETSDLTSQELIRSNAQILSYTHLKIVTDFDPAVLKGQYRILGEIKGGGMSRVFLARKENVGNDWIIKFVPKAIGELTSEAEILKSLNHISLPKIIDIFNDDTGLYIVESFVEGKGMNRVLKENNGIHEFTILDWAYQLAKVLSYLHKSHDIISRRFGNTLPDERMHWPINEQTDIYSFGVVLYEAAEGHIPTHDTLHRLESHLSKRFCNIVYKCLAVNPADRYPTIEALLSDLQKQQVHAKPHMVKTLFVRRMAIAASFVSVLASLSGFTSGFYFSGLEAQAAMFVNPEIITVSLNQSSEIRVTRALPNSTEALPLDPAY
jgi:serine/threonine protein kinase